MTARSIISAVVGAMVARTASAEPTPTRSIEVEVGLGGAALLAPGYDEQDAGGLGTTLGMSLRVGRSLGVTVALHTAEFGIHQEDAPVVSALSGGLSWRVPLSPT